MGEVRLFGIRHHGPGSARSLRHALAQLQPDLVLIEGPPEAAPFLDLVTHEHMKPPVAILSYDPNEPEDAAFYPFAEFSPEWIALRYAAEAGLTVRMIDLSAPPRSQASEGPSRSDPLRQLAKIAGFEDPERWWDAAFERRMDGMDVFEAVAQLMTAAREGSETPPEEEAREAAMRLAIRAGLQEGFARVAVVCGAWHVPALAAKVPVSQDQATLRGRPKSKRVATWVPWTYDRLGSASGYPAGVVSPAYYEHLWQFPSDQLASGWLLRTARLLREHDLDASPASVIEAVRLAHALAALRDQSVPGLEELREAAASVLCGGNPVPLQLIDRELIIGQRIGEVPADSAQPPLLSDLTSAQRRLRLKAEAQAKDLQLDLRNENDRERSHLLHRLRILGVEWGTPTETGRTSGTFREAWSLQWRPDFVVSLIAASRWGSTIESASTAMLVDRARQTKDLSELAGYAADSLTSALLNAVEPVIRSLEQAAAVAHDLGQLMGALPALGGILKYGSVRKIDATAVESVYGSILARVCISLPYAANSLDDEAADRLRDQVDQVHATVALLQREEDGRQWQVALSLMANTPGHPLVIGSAVRHLFDGGHLSGDEVATRLARLSSSGTPPADLARWLEGFLGSSGQILLHAPTLWTLIDDWVQSLAEDTFNDVLPLLRRTFSTFSSAERRQIGELAANGPQTIAAEKSDLDENRAALVMPILELLLGTRSEVTTP